MNNGQIFKLISNAQIDINDLRKISEKEMMLFLMAKKINRIKPRSQRTPLRVGNVSVVHGEKKRTTTELMIKDDTEDDWILKETNGAKALFDHKYYTNTVVKLNKILTKYSLK